VFRDGKLVDGKTGKPFTIHLILDSPIRVPYALHYADALRVLGIETKVRVLDSAQMLQRLRTLDFEAFSMERMMSNTPNFELRNYFSSAVAMRPNTFNLAGVRNHAVDSLIASALTATTRDQFVTACRALDRVLLYNYYAVDTGVVPGVAYAFWNRFGKPAEPPRYATGFPHIWWFDADADAKIRRPRAGRFRVSPILKCRVVSQVDVSGRHCPRRPPRSFHPGGLGRSPVRRHAARHRDPRRRAIARAPGGASVQWIDERWGMLGVRAGRVSRLRGPRLRLQSASSPAASSTGRQASSHRA
jgi:hypothetical protein